MQKTNDKPVDVLVGDVIAYFLGGFILLVPNVEEGRKLPRVTRNAGGIPSFPRCALKNNQKIRFARDSKATTLHDINDTWHYMSCGSKGPISPVEEGSLIEII